MAFSPPSRYLPPKSIAPSPKEVMRVADVLVPPPGRVARPLVLLRLLQNAAPLLGAGPSRAGVPRPPRPDAVPPPPPRRAQHRLPRLGQRRRALLPSRGPPDRPR